MSEPSARASNRRRAPSPIRIAVSSLGLFVLLALPVLPVAAQTDDVPAEPSPSAQAEPSRSAQAEPSPSLDTPSRPVRITIPSLDIDLPVISSERNVRGNPAGYPLCDVAQYWTEFDLPGAPGTSWVYAHAQPGMFLPLYEAAQRTARPGLIGTMVRLQLRDGRQLHYRIDDVERFAGDRSIARGTGGRQQQLVLQTSVGPPGTVPKLLASARLVRAELTDEPRPVAQPRACSDPAPRPARQRAATSVADEVPAAAVAKPAETTGFLFGSGVLLFGAGLLAFTLFRRGA